MKEEKWESITNPKRKKEMTHHSISEGTAAVHIVVCGPEVYTCVCVCVCL